MKDCVSASNINKAGIPLVSDAARWIEKNPSKVCKSRTYNFGKLAKTSLATDSYWYSVSPDGTAIAIPKHTTTGNTGWAIWGINPIK